MILKLATCCLEAPESVVNLTEWRSLCFALDKTRHRQFLWDFLHTNAQILLTEEDLYQSAELIHPSPRAECMFDFSYPVDQCPRLGWQKVTFQRANWGQRALHGFLAEGGEDPTLPRGLDDVIIYLQWLSARPAAQPHFYKYCPHCFCHTFHEPRVGSLDKVWNWIDDFLVMDINLKIINLVFRLRD